MTRWGAIVVALAATGCASSAAVTPAPRDAGPEAMVIPPDDPLDDPMLRVQCPPGLDDPCGPGRHCIAIGPGFTGICVRDGARGGLCREGSLGCDEAIPCLDQWCEQGNHFGARTVCDGRPCGLNEGCVALDGRLRCVLHGSPGGYCRQGAVAPCEAGLRCDDAALNRRRCGRPLGIGATCVVAGGSTDFCADGTVCVGVGPRGICREQGSEGTPCGSSTPCLANLECQLAVAATSTACARPRLVGAICEPDTPGASRCIAGSSCAEEERVCVPDGALHGACRERVPVCDGALRCHRDQPVCVPELPDGAPCAMGSRSADCRTDSSCEVVSATFERIVQECVPNGALHGLCRLSKEPCEPGLACDRSLHCRAL